MNALIPVFHTRTIACTSGRLTNGLRGCSRPDWCARGAAAQGPYQTICMIPLITCVSLMPAPGLRLSFAGLAPCHVPEHMRLLESVTAALAKEANSLSRRDRLRVHIINSARPWTLTVYLRRTAAPDGSPETPVNAARPGWSDVRESRFGQLPECRSSGPLPFRPARIAASVARARMWIRRSLRACRSCRAGGQTRRLVGCRPDD